jgi:propionate CoA-transferase
VRKVRVLSPADAASLVHDGDVVTISSSSGLGCPEDILAAIGERFLETGSPRGLTSINPIAAGDMYGLKGIDHLAHSGLLAKIIAGSLPSGPSRMEPPEIWKMIEGEEIDAYNFPSGVIFQMHRAGAAKQPGVFTRVGADTFIDPHQQGGRMNERSPMQYVEWVTVKDEDWLFYPSIVPNVAIIRATTADEAGNLTFEDEGSPLGALDQAYATHNNGGIVVAQVKRIASAHSQSPQQVKVPGILVDAVVVSPNQLQTTMTVNDPAISGQIRRPLKLLPPVELSCEKVIARRAARELMSGEIVNLGFGVSALVPHVLVEEGLAQEVTWVIEQGAVGGVPLLDFAFGCSQNPDAIMQSVDQFTLLQGAGFHKAVLSFLEVDRQGNVNVHHLPNRRHVTAGVGGFADITSSAREILFLGSFTAGARDIAVGEGRLTIRTDGAHDKFVSEVSEITFSGQRAMERGAKVTYITERCVMELTSAGLVVAEIAPGVDLDEDVLERCEFPVAVASNLKLMSADLFRIEPINLAFSELPDHPHFARLADER